MQLEDGTILDSELKCEEVRSTIASKVKDLLLNAPPDLGKMPMNNSENAGKWTFASGVIDSRCLSSDDPRLKGK
jgi:hypothetical protein